MFRDADTRYIAEQLLRAATSLVANQRSANASRSQEEWAAKLIAVRREADEARFWLGFINDTDTAPGRTVDLKRLTEEADELTRVLATPYRPAAPLGSTPSPGDAPAQPEAPPAKKLIG